MQQGLPGPTAGDNYPRHQTPVQDIARSIIDQPGDGAIRKPAESDQRIAQTNGVPRDNH